MATPTTAYLSIGGNLSPEQRLPEARVLLAQAFPGARFSPLYRSAAVGFSGPDFLNAAAAINTTQSPEALVERLHAMEDKLGRRRQGPRFSSRSMDIDLVLYGDCVQHGPGLITLPRDELRHAAHVLKPIIDLAPDLTDPQSGKRLTELLAALPDASLRLESLDNWPDSNS